jgi:hypothetical protein
MSELGHSRRADQGHLSLVLPQYLRKLTQIQPFGLRRFVPIGDICSAAKPVLFDHLVGGSQKHGWHGEAEDFRRP